MRGRSPSEVFLCCPEAHSFLPKRGIHHQSLDFLARQGVKIIINYGYHCRLEFFLNQRISLSRESLVKEWTLTQCFCCCKPLATGGGGVPVQTLVSALINAVLQEEVCQAAGWDSSAW